MAQPNKREFPYVIRDLTTKDVDQYNKLLRYAFQVTEQELMEYGWESEEIKQSKFPIIERVDILGGFAGDKLVSQFAVYPLKMNIRNRTYDIGFITSVSTYPEYTGEGIMSRLMKKSLLRMKEKGQTLALLYPYSIPLYRKFGWEIVSSKISFRISDRQIPTNRSAEGQVQRVDWENDDFIKLHTEFAKQTHGCLYRNSLAWDEYWRWTEDSTQVAIYYDRENQPLGYLVYLLKEDIMHIKEMIYLNREAQAGLWEYIHAHDSMIDEVRGNTYSNESIAFDLDDSAIKETVRPYIMGRIIDIPAFLKRYSCKPKEKKITIAFAIRDELLGWNNQTFQVAFQNGRCYLTEEPAEYQVAMTINSLSALLLGYKTAVQLYRLERIDGSVEAINQLEDVLYHEPPYISDYI